MRWTDCSDLQKLSRYCFQIFTRQTQSTRKVFGTTTFFCIHDDDYCTHIIIRRAHSNIDILYEYDGLTQSQIIVDNNLLICAPNLWLWGFSDDGFRKKNHKLLKSPIGIMCIVELTKINKFIILILCAMYMLCYNGHCLLWSTSHYDMLWFFFASSENSGFRTCFFVSTTIINHNISTAGAHLQYNKGAIM